MTILNAPRYTVDLSRAPDERWNEMLADPWAGKIARKLVKKASADVVNGLSQVIKVPVLAGGINAVIKKLMVVALRAGSGDDGYCEELSKFGEISKINFEDLVQANLGYEMANLHCCSSVAFYRPKIGMIHARNMDWPLNGLEKSTALIDYKNAEAGRFCAVSMPGFVGVLSGVAKGRFSATINLAPGRGIFKGKNIKGASAPMLLRYVFEKAESFDSAVEMLRRNRTFAPVFYQVTGCKKNESVIIHMRPDTTNRVYKYTREPLAVTNHEDNFSKPKYLGEECDDEGYNTCIRLETIIEAARNCKETSLSGMISILCNEPVLNGNTKQSMVLHPKTGTVILQEC